jgi:hypothetical protein
MASSNFEMHQAPRYWHSCSADSEAAFYNDHRNDLGIFVGTSQNCRTHPTTGTIRQCWCRGNPARLLMKKYVFELLCVTPRPPNETHGHAITRLSVLL